MQLATQTLAKELNVSDKEAINILNLVFAGVDPDIITEQRKAHSLLTIAKNRLEEASYNHRKVVEEAKNKLEKALEKSFEESSKDIHVELHNDNEQLLHALILAGLLADEDKDILSKS